MLKSEQLYISLEQSQTAAGGGGGGGASVGGGSVGITVGGEGDVADGGGSVGCGMAVGVGPHNPCSVSLASCCISRNKS